jgi:hypothetical protein
MHRLGITLLAFGIVAGCADRPETIDTSGKHPALGTTAPMSQEAKDAEVDTGRLLVLMPGTGYTVYTEDGYKVAHEANPGNRPVERKLAPGRYFVRLDHKVPGRDFWVTIARGQVTQVEKTVPSEAPPAVK